MSYYEYSFLFLISFFSGLIQGITGFGAVLIALPLLTFLLGIKIAVPLSNIISFWVSLFILFQLHNHLIFHRISHLVIASIPGIWIGVKLLTVVPSRKLEIYLGIVLILVVVLQGTLRNRNIESPIQCQYVVGFMSGVLGGSIGAYGPPVAAYAALQSWQHNEVKSTLSGYFTFISMVIFFFHLIKGVVTNDVLMFAAISIPFLFFGSLLGNFISDFKASIFKHIMLLFILFCGIMLICNK